MIFRQIETAAGQVNICFTGTDRNLAADSLSQVYRNIRQRLDNRCAIVWVNQVHGDTVITCEGAAQPIECAGEGDAIVTRQAALAPLVRTADCIPILLYSETTIFAGAVHAGWRGLQKKILSRTLAAARAAGTDIAGLRFAVGPFIREKSYEVGSDVAQQFDEQFSTAREDGKFMLDLRRIVQAELAANGIQPRQVTWFDTDTLSSPEWFSARRGDTGRNMALVFYTA